MIHKSLPQIFYVDVPNNLLGPKMPEGWTRGLLHGLYGREGQMILCHILLESGAHWSGIPLHLVKMDWKGTPSDRIFGQKDLQPWGCMGEALNISLLEYLEGLKVTPRFMDVEGRHTGIIVDWNGKFSRHPEEHKPLSLIHLASGQFSLLPNNYFTLSDPHFTKATEATKLYRRGDNIWWE
jgi:hypothetical protein